jgi:hypothetical protein
MKDIEDKLKIEIVGAIFYNPGSYFIGNPAKS